jgi:transcriptional regulator with GAF, ATPase, and Fis domain
MRRIFQMLPRIASSESTVLIEGETGTGKTLVAEAIHQASPRAAHPFSVVDCGAIPPSLIESELFGHDKGAFTGAAATRVGAIEAGSGGTVFFDEVGELPLDLQPRLLRVIEDRTIKRVGGRDAFKIDVRVIAATNQDLRGAVNRGAFRADLYYRLNVASLRLPPLRERRDDIPLLVEGSTSNSRDRKHPRRWSTSCAPRLAERASRAAVERASCSAIQLWRAMLTRFTDAGRGVERGR